MLSSLARDIIYIKLNAENYSWFCLLFIFVIHTVAEPFHHKPSISFHTLGDVNYLFPFLLPGETVVELSVCRCGDSKNLGKSPDEGPKNYHKLSL